MNLLDRFCWMLDLQRLSANSPHLHHALMKAVQEDQFDVVKQLLTCCVDAFGQYLDRVAEPGESLFEISVAHLSSELSFYLLENNLVPEVSWSVWLVTKCVQSYFVEEHEPNVSEKVSR